MRNSVLAKSQKRSTNRPAMIEGLESRCLLSAAPPLVQARPVTPGKILAGLKPGTEVVVIRNPTPAAVTEPVTITLAPSLDGVNAAGAFSTPGVSETLTIRKHGAVSVKVPFVPPITLAAGKYHTLVSVDLNGTVYSLVAPKTYALTLPPLPTTTPSLLGHYSGLIVATSSQTTGFFGGGTTTTIHEATFIWETTGQDLTSLTGIFAVGSQQTAGSMEGYELNNGVIHYTLTSADINYTIDAKVSANGTIIKGKFKGTLVNNIFKSLGGTFKLTLQTG